MGHRRQKRLVFAYPIKLWLVDSQGNAHVENACTLDVSAMGLRVFSRALQQPRQEVTISYLGKKARYRVVWIGAKGSAAEGVAGLMCLEPEKSLFADTIPGTNYLDDYASEVVTGSSAAATSAAPAAKILLPRYECEGSAELRIGDNSTRTWAPITHIWLQGCYVSCTSPPELDKTVHLRLFLDDVSIKVSGKVDARDPGMGMSVVFGVIAADERTLLERVVGKFSKTTAIPAVPVAPAVPAAAPVSPRQSNPALKQWLADWFAHNDILTRQQYKQLVEQTEKDVVIG